MAEATPRRRKRIPIFLDDMTDVRLVGLGTESGEFTSFIHTGLCTLFQFVLKTNMHALSCIFYFFSSLIKYSSLCFMDDMLGFFLADNK